MGKTAFGKVYNNNLTNVVDKKKRNILFCGNNCRRIITHSYDDYYLYMDKNKTLKNRINKDTLNINLYTSLKVPSTECDNVPLNPCLVPFYKYYNIENGKLFGDTTCSFNHYREYFVPNRPNKDAFFVNMPSHNITNDIHGVNTYVPPNMHHSNHGVNTYVPPNMHHSNHEAKVLPIKNHLISEKSPFIQFNNLKLLTKVNKWIDEKLLLNNSKHKLVLNNFKKKKSKKLNNSKPLLDTINTNIIVNNQTSIKLPLNPVNLSSVTFFNISGKKVIVNNNSDTLIYSSFYAPNGTDKFIMENNRSCVFKYISDNKMNAWYVWKT